jgi:O-antigen ligase
MSLSSRAPARSQWGVPVALSVFALVCAFGGGASRLDALSQPLVLLAALLVCGVTGWRKAALVNSSNRAPLIFLGLLALWIALQLIPLPPALWTSLPGRTLYAETTRVVGIETPWRPIGLTPDLEWASLLSLLPLLAVLLAVPALDEAGRRWILPALVGFVLLSGLLGLAQVTSHSARALRFYQITNAGSAVGLFANRNHQALLLVLGLPMLAALSRMVNLDQRYQSVPKWVALGLAIFILPLIVVTGSRGGLLLLAVGVPGAAMLMVGKRGKHGSVREASRYATVIKWLPVVLIAGIIALAAAFARGSAIDRLFATNLAEEQRSQMLPTLLEMARTFFPFGSGFGSFDSVYRGFEPDGLLNLSYMNQAHNDLVQLVIEGGLPAVFLLIAFMGWVARRAVAHWLSVRQLSDERLLGRLATIVVPCILLFSLADYPLRTPTIAVIFALSCLWLGSPPQSDARDVI